MQFLHSIHCVIFDNPYNKHWIGTYFVYSHWFLKKDDARVMLETYINGRSQRIKH